MCTHTHSLSYSHANISDLFSQGMTTKDLNKILSKHEQQQEDLLSEQEQWKIKQSEKIKVRREL